MNKYCGFCFKELKEKRCDCNRFGSPVINFEEMIIKKIMNNYEGEYISHDCGCCGSNNFTEEDTKQMLKDLFKQLEDCKEVKR